MLRKNTGQSPEDEMNSALYAPDIKIKSVS